MNDTTVTTPNELEIRVERIFDAPRAHVFSVWTDPKLIPEWWGDGTVVEEMDVRPWGWSTPGRTSISSTTVPSPHHSGISFGIRPDREDVGARGIEDALDADLELARRRDGGVRSPFSSPLSSRSR